MRQSTEGGLMGRKTNGVGLSRTKTEECSSRSVVSVSNRSGRGPERAVEVLRVSRGRHSERVYMLSAFEVPVVVDLR